jgi:hypothetical protein
MPALLAARARELGAGSPETAFVFWGKAAESAFAAIRPRGPSLVISPSNSDQPLPGARSFAAGARPLSAAFVARRILRAADRGRRHVAPGFGAGLLLLAGPPFARYLEALQRRLLRRHPEDPPPP